MTKRIGLIGTVPNPAKGGLVAPELSALLDLGTELIGYPSSIQAFPYTALERTLQDVGHLEAAFRAAEDGCGAVVIDSVGDYGLEAMRASLPVPAIGAGEVGMAEAAAGGRTFAIVSVWPPSMNYIIEARLRAYAQANRCRGIYNVGRQEQLEGLGGVSAQLERIRSSHQDIFQAVSGAIRAAQADGADAIMLGCTCMSAMAADLQAGATLPVINPLAAAVFAATKAEPVAPPSVRDGRREMLRRIVEVVGRETPEPCPVCIA